MTEDEMLKRTRQFAIEIMTLVDELPRDRVADHCGRQLLRSGTSTAANYRAACRAKSRNDMISKLSVVEEECDECLFWFDMLCTSNRVQTERLDRVEREAGEILSMIVASIRTLRNSAQIQNPKSKI